jgi:hypothetical protein
MAEPIRWHLELGGEVIARIADADDYDFPWTYGRLVDSPGFERFRLFFSDTDDWPEDDAELEAICGEVQNRGGFVLRDLKTGEVHENLSFNHKGEYVWFRIG